MVKKKDLEVPRKHHLVIYSNDDYLTRLLKSMDRLAKEGDLFRCFFGPPHSPSTELLTKLKWYDGTTSPYYYSSRKPREEEQSQIQTKIQVKSKNDIM